MGTIELLQGALDMLVLRVLSGGPMHGWGIAARLELLSKDVLRVEEGSIYPTLHGMERKGWINTGREHPENNRPGRFCRMCAAIAAVMVVLCLPCICSAKSQGSWRDAFREIWGNVIVATDTTPEGRKLTPPTPEHPVYYLGTSLGPKFSLPGDRLPDKKEMNLLVARVLAKQGYLDARPGAHEPSLFLVLQWSYLGRVSLGFVGYNWRYDQVCHPFEVVVMLDTVGAPNSIQPHPCYGIVITAFEYKSARTRHPIVCWQTRITLPAVGKSMAQALPTMIVSAGPAIGRETTRLPFLGDADAVPEGHVTLGDLIGYEDEPAPTGKGAEPKE